MNFTQTELAYKLTSQADDKWVPHKKAQVALARYTKLHPYNIGQEVVIVGMGARAESRYAVLKGLTAKRCAL